MQASMETYKAAKNGNEQAQRVMYLDYVNNFLTVAGFSSYYGSHQNAGRVYLKWWREVHEEYCAMVKGDS